MSSPVQPALGQKLSPHAGIRADKGVGQWGAAAPAEAGLPSAGARATRIRGMQDRQAAGYAWGRPQEFGLRKPGRNGWPGKEAAARTRWLPAVPPLAALPA